MPATIAGSTRPMIANASYQTMTWTSSGIERATSMNQPMSRRSQPSGRSGHREGDAEDCRERHRDGRQDDRVEEASREVQVAPSRSTSCSVISRSLPLRPAWAFAPPCPAG